MQCKLRSAITPVLWKIKTLALCVLWGFGYGGSNGVTAIFVAWPEVTTRSMSVCLCVYQTITFESFDVRISYLHIQCIYRDARQVRIWRSSGQGQGHRSKKDRKLLFPQCKLRSLTTPVLYKIAPRGLRVPYMGFLSMADAMVWPPFSSRDGKWRLLKCMHSQAVIR